MNSLTLLEQLQYNRRQMAYLEQLQLPVKYQDNTITGGCGYGGSGSGYGGPQIEGNPQGGQAVRTSVYGGIPMAGQVQNNAARHNTPVPPQGRAPNKARGGGPSTYQRGDFQSGRGRGGHSNAPASRGHHYTPQKPFPTSGGSRGGYQSTNYTTRDYGQNAPTYQPRPFGSLARQKNPLLRPIKFVKSDLVLFEEEDEIFLPEVAEVDVENPDDAAPTADRVEEIFNPTLAASESSSSSEEEGDDDDDDGEDEDEDEDDEDDDEEDVRVAADPSPFIEYLEVPEEDVSTLAQAIAEIEVARVDETEAILADSTLVAEEITIESRVLDTRTEPAAHPVQATGNQWNNANFLAKYQEWKAGLTGTVEVKAPVQVSAPSAMTKAERKRKRAEDLRLAKASSPPTKKNPSKTKGKKVKKQPNMSIVWKEEQSIRAFIKDPSRSTFKLGSMKKQKRKLINILSSRYHLQLTGGGKKKKQGITLTKTNKTRLVNVNAYNSGYAFQPSAPSKAGGQASGGSGADASKHHHKEGEIVGQHAAKITEENVGYRLLQNMGWSEGDRIGVTAGGLEAPLKVVVKITRLGLGVPVANKKTSAVVVPS